MEYIHLTGTEAVERAANKMQSAADSIQSSMNSLSFEMEKCSRMFNEFILALSDVADAIAKRKKGGEQ